MVVANRQHDAIAIGRGRQAGFRFEEPAEVADIAKAERVGNLLDRQGRTFQPQPCFMDDALLDQLTRRLGELAAADVVQPVRRNADCLGVSTDRSRKCISTSCLNRCKIRDASPCACSATPSTPDRRHRITRIVDSCACTMANEPLRGRCNSRTTRSKQFWASATVSGSSSIAATTRRSIRYLRSADSGSLPIAPTKAASSTAI